jgi:hypothetical protein
MSVGVQDYPSVPQISAGLMDIPSSMLSDSQPRLVASQVRQVQLPSQSGDQQAGGVLNFQISTGVGQGYMKRGSCYLRTKIVITTAGPLTSTGACLFDNLLAGVTAIAFGGPLTQASQIINRLTLLSGGQVLEQINNYHQVANVVNSHASSQSYTTADHRMYENAFQWISNATCESVTGSAGNPYVYTMTVCIPLLSGLLQSQHHLPLFLLTGNVQLQLDLNVIGAAFCEGTTGNAHITGVSFQNNTLMYEQLSVDAVMEATLKQSLMRAPFSIPFNSFVSLAASAQGTISQPIGLNLSSVYGVLVAFTSLPTDVGSRKFLVKQGLSSIKLFADGRLVNSHLVDTDPLFFVEMNKVFNLAFDPARTSVLSKEVVTAAVANADGATARYIYDNYVFTSGICLTRVSEDGVVMSGSPVNQMLVELQGIANAVTAYYIVPHQLILTIDVAGTAAIIR